MYKPSNSNLPHISDFLLSAGKKRRTNAVQAEVSKLYDRSKNSYSKKFQMKMQLMNEPKKSLETTAKGRVPVSATSIREAGRAGGVRERGGSLEGRREDRASMLHNNSHHQHQHTHSHLNRSLDLPRTHHHPPPQQQQPNTLNNSGFIRIQGEQAYLQGVQTRQTLTEQYKQIIKQIEKVKENCENEQTKLKNADELLKSKKRVLNEEKKDLKMMDRVPNEIEELEMGLRREKEEVVLMVHQHQRTVGDLKETLQHIQEFKQAQLDKLQYIDKVKKEEEEKIQKRKLQASEIAKLRSEEQILLNKRQQLQTQNYQAMQSLTKLKVLSVPPFDIHKKYIEKLQKVIMLGDMERVEGYIQIRDGAKNDKKVFQKLKEELAKKKDQNNDVKKKLEEKKKQLDKLEKVMREKGTAVLEMNQKLLEYDLKR